MPTDTQVNDLKINVLTEAQYEQIQSPSSTELYLVPEVVDTTPTSGSTNPITSGGVYNALQNIPAQEQSDWNETDNTDPAFIKNKPSIPDSTSDLTNDSGFITANDVPQEVLVCNYDSTNNTMDKTPEQILQAKDNGMAILCKEGSARIYYCTIANQSTIFFESLYSENSLNLIFIIKWVSNSGWTTSSKLLQDKLVSSGNSQNIKTINGNSVLGSGDLTIGGGDVNVQSDWNQSDSTADDYIKNKPSFATVATSGSYNDLDNKPTIPSAPGTLDTTSGVSLETSANEDLSGNIKLHEVSKTGDYNDLSHKLEAGDNILIRNTHLPLGYEELEYISNGSSTRVNTGITPDVDNIKVEIVVKPTSGIWRIFQSAGTTTNTCGFTGNNSDYSISWQYRRETIVTSSMLRNTEHYMLIRATAANGSVELYVKDLFTGDESTNIGTYTYGTIGYPAQFSLFGSVAGLYASSGNMVASLKFWVNGVLLLDYVPCRRIQDNVVGFYNKVTDTLITETNGTINAGTLAKNNVINVTGLAGVATSGDYNDLTNKPTIPTPITIYSGSSAPTSNIGSDGDIYIQTTV